MLSLFPFGGPSPQQQQRAADLAGDVQGAVGFRAIGKDDGVVSLAQSVQADVLSEADVAEEPDAGV